jgi:choline dehydrogenase
VHAPIIDPNHFSEPDDLRFARSPIRIAGELILMPAFDELLGSEIAPASAIRANEKPNRYICETATSVYHSAGTHRLGIYPLAVIDPMLRVRAVKILNAFCVSAIKITVDRKAYTVLIYNNE